MTWLHRLAVLLAASTIVLVLIGALVTSTGAGLSVPTWPSTFGAAAGGTLPAGAGLQLAHRTAAALVGLLTILVAALAWRVDPRPWMKGLALASIVTLLAQAVYGGISVINRLPALFSVFHAAVAQFFVGLTLAMALFTSPRWLARTGTPTRGTGAGDRALGRWAVAALAVIYVQVLIGAAMRHSYTSDGRPAGFAIPDYPLAFGQLLPLSQLTSWAAGLDFLHRVTALASAVLVSFIAVRVFRRHAAEADLVGPASLLGLVLLAQIALGGLTVLSGGHPAVSATHAVVVSAALGASLALAARSFTPAAAVPAAGHTAGNTAGKGAGE